MTEEAPTTSPAPTSAAAVAAPVRQRLVELLALEEAIASRLGTQRAAVAAHPGAAAAFARFYDLATAQRDAVRLLAQTGQQPAALRQYHALRAALCRELDAEPDAATAQLVRAIRGARPAPARGQDGARSRVIQVCSPRPSGPEPSGALQSVIRVRWVTPRARRARR